MPFASAFRLRLQKIEGIDEPFAGVAQPWREAAANQQLTLFEQQNPRVDDLSPAETLRERNRLVWGDNKLVMASLLPEFKGNVDLIDIDPPFDVGADFSMSVAIFLNTIKLIHRDILWNLKLRLNPRRYTMQTTNFGWNTPLPN